MTSSKNNRFNFLALLLLCAFPIFLSKTYAKPIAKDAALGSEQSGGDSEANLLKSKQGVSPDRQPMGRAPAIPFTGDRKSGTEPIELDIGRTESGKWIIRHVDPNSKFAGKVFQFQEFESDDAIWKAIGENPVEAVEENALPESNISNGSTSPSEPVGHGESF